MVLGNSIPRILRDSEALGGPALNHVVIPGWCPPKEPKTLGWEFRVEGVTNVLMMVTLGGSISCILQGLEPPGCPASNPAAIPGGYPSKDCAALDWELRGAGVDECLEHGGPRKLQPPKFTKLGGPGMSRL